MYHKPQKNAPLQHITKFVRQKTKHKKQSTIISILFTFLFIFSLNAKADNFIFRQGYDNGLVTTNYDVEDNFLTGPTATFYANRNGDKEFMRLGTFWTPMVWEYDLCEIIIRFNLESLNGQEILSNGFLNLKTFFQPPDHLYDFDPATQHFYNIYIISPSNSNWEEMTSSYLYKYRHPHPSEKPFPSSFINQTVTNIPINQKSNRGDTVEKRWYGEEGIGTNEGVESIMAQNITTPTNDWFNITIPKTLIERWTDGDNAGLLIRCNDLSITNFVAIHSSESTNFNNRPFLSIEATPEPSSFLIIFNLIIFIIRKK